MIHWHWHSGVADEGDHENVQEQGIVPPEIVEVEADSNGDPTVGVTVRRGVVLEKQVPLVLH